MRMLGPVFLLFWLASAPAQGASHWYDCLAAPTYRCLVDHAAAEAGQIPGRVPRAYATALVAGAQAVGGLEDEARFSAEDARLFGAIISDDADYGFLVSQIVWARAWAGDLDLAGDMLGWTSDPYALALGYGALAEAQAHHGYPDFAARSLRWAMEEAENVRHDRGTLLYHRGQTRSHLSHEPQRSCLHRSDARVPPRLSTPRKGRSLNCRASL